MAKANKTQLIKDALKKNPTASPKEIAEKLKAHKITGQYVSTVKSKLTVKKKSTKKTAQKKAGTSISSVVTQARDLVKQVGSVEEAKKLLDALD
ncbi:MAG: hypothetical protein O7C75_18050 [Verrucomicrobia bacterium]|nr:hypothetical protein [Verrucomicrobiota bacterium]